MLAHRNLMLGSLAPSVFSSLSDHLTLVHLEVGSDLLGSLRKRNVFFPVTCLVAVSARTVSTPDTYLFFGGINGSIGLSESLATPHLGYSAIVCSDGYAFTAPRNVFERHALPTSHQQSMRLHSIGAIARLGVINASCATLHGAVPRVARLLLEASAESPTDIHISMGHKDFAELHGVRRETVTQVFKNLENRSLVDTGRGKIKYIDKVGLERVACECFRESARTKAFWHAAWRGEESPSMSRVIGVPVLTYPEVTDIQAGGGVTRSPLPAVFERSGARGR